MKNHSDSLDAIAKAIQAAQKIALISHYHPDADAYGSIGAMALGLSKLSKEISLFNLDGVTDRYTDIPGLKGLKNTPTDEHFDLWIICDCGDFERIGKDFQSTLAKAPRTVNIDHHISNQHFGTLNYVDAGASSTCELIFLILEAVGVKPDREIGVALLSGIVGDTGSFRYSNTSLRTLQVTAQLVENGASLSEVSKMLFGSYSASAVKMQAEAMSNLQLHFGGKVSEVLVDRELLRKHGATSEDTELLVEKARDIRGVAVSFFVREDEDVWKVSLRSADDRYDLSTLAQQFGGGGHRAAAAFRWRGAYHDLRNQLLKGLEELVRG